MSGHNKFSKIKHLKAKNDAQKSKHFGKLVRLITVEAKKAKGNLSSPGLSTAIEKARKENMPNDTIDRAVKKAISDNRNKAAQEIKHILSLNNCELASPGSALWAFQKTQEGWAPTSTTPLEDADIEILTKLVEELENNEEVQEVFTNAE